MPLLQNETLSKTLHMKMRLICMKMNLDAEHMNGFVRGLVLTHRREETRFGSIIGLFKTVIRPFSQLINNWALIYQQDFPLSITQRYIVMLVKLYTCRHFLYPLIFFFSQVT